MISVSEEFYNELLHDNRKYLCTMTVTLADGTVLPFDNSNIWEKTFSLTDASSESGVFTIGSFVSTQFSVTINNMNEDYNDYVFEDAVITPSIALELSSTTETIPLGVFKVDKATYNGSTISLTCLDNATKFDQPYGESILAYPATLLEIIQDACTDCGVELASVDLPNSSYVVEERPRTDSLTYGEVIASCAQIMCQYAKIDRYGRLSFGWYDMDELDIDDTYGEFYLTLEDGSYLLDYSRNKLVADKDWQYMPRTQFGENKYHVLGYANTLTVAADDITITGVKVTEEFDSSEDDPLGMYTAGRKGYVIDVSGNRLIQRGQAQAVATYLNDHVGGMTFRQFSGAFLNNPSIESGDVCFVIDRRGRVYKSIISSRTFTVGTFESVACDAETPARNKTLSYTKAQKLLEDANAVSVKIAKSSKEELEMRYDQALDSLTNLMANSLGVYSTEEVQQDGSIIYFLHNEPTLEASQVIWKQTADAFAVSTDGGNTWNAGITSDGNLLVQVISAIGVNADWITAGLLQDAYHYNYWNLNTGEFRLSPNTAVGNSTVATTDDLEGYATTEDLEGYATTSDLDPVVNAVDVQYGVSTSSSTTPSSWSTTLSWEQGKYAWTRMKMTAVDGTVSYSSARLIAGSTGIGSASVTEQYYLSTSSSSQTGGSWSDAMPAWVSGRYYWTRSKISWSDGTTTYTTPQLARALTSGNQSTDNLDSSLNQSEVFNRLTNNGTAQGIYLSGGQLYVNAAYINASTLSSITANLGTVTAGKVQSSSGNSYWDLSTDTFVLNESASSTNIQISNGTIRCMDNNSEARAFMAAGELRVNNSGGLDSKIYADSYGGRIDLMRNTDQSWAYFRAYTASDGNSHLRLAWPYSSKTVFEAKSIVDRSQNIVGGGALELTGILGTLAYLGPDMDRATTGLTGSVTPAKLELFDHGGNLMISSHVEKSNGISCGRTQWFNAGNEMDAQMGSTGNGGLIQLSQDGKTVYQISINSSCEIILGVRKRVSTSSGWRWADSMTYTTINN